MEKHILLIDSLDKLVIKKDSSLLLAHTLQSMGVETYLLFKPDLYFQNIKKPQLDVYSFKSQLLENSNYLESFTLSDSPINIDLDSQICIHMRLDPPFDLVYLQTLWTLQAIKSFGVRIINDSQGVLSHNEKLYAYANSHKKFPSFLGDNNKYLEDFLKSLKEQNYEEVILKPVDLFQGEGVTKVKLDIKNVIHLFEKMVHKYQGKIVAQPYIKSVEQGEVRSIFFNGHEIGSIIKVPPSGSHLANISQGASFKAIELSEYEFAECKRISNELSKEGILWTAFDVLGGMISEINITCPGLLTEVSEAHEKNLARDIVDLMINA